MIKISELKEGDVMKSETSQLTVVQNLGKVVVLETNNGSTQIYSEKELDKYRFELVQPIQEKKYYMGFEIREYPERPIVEVSDAKDGSYRCLRRLIVVNEDSIICQEDSKDFPEAWNYIYRIPETNIVEPTSSGTREGDGC